MPGLVPGIHVLTILRQERRGWPGRSSAMTESSSPQQPLPRHMIEFEPDAVGVFEQQRVITGRPLIFARRADDGCAKGSQEGMQLIDVGALAGAEAEMMQADPFLLKRRTGALGRRRADPDCRSAADTIICRFGI